MMWNKRRVLFAAFLLFGGPLLVFFDIQADGCLPNPIGTIESGSLACGNVGIINAVLMSAACVVIGAIIIASAKRRPKS